jgi:alcohol dehydrogenase
MVLLSDILPTGFECGTLNARVTPGNTVAVVGAGPVGLAALLSAQFYSPSQVIVIDQDDNRLRVAKEFGATATVNSAKEDAVAFVKSLTDGLGVDSAIEAVGIPPTFQLCQDIIAPGGTIANIGVHGTKVDLHLENLWSHNISASCLFFQSRLDLTRMLLAAITTKILHNFSAPMLLKMVQSGKVDPKRLITHTYKFSEVQTAYSTFQAAAKNNALKVIIDLVK